MLNELDFEILNPFLEGPRRLNGGSQRVQRLIDSKYLILATYRSTSLPGCGPVQVPDLWQLSDLGENAVLEFKKQSQKDAERIAEHKKDRKSQLVNTLLGALAGALLTLVLEHFSELVQFLCLLFQ